MSMGIFVLLTLGFEALFITEFSFISYFDTKSGGKLALKLLNTRRSSISNWLVFYTFSWSAASPPMFNFVWELVKI